MCSMLWLRQGATEIGHRHTHDEYRLEACRGGGAGEGENAEADGSRMLEAGNEDLNSDGIRVRASSRVWEENEAFKAPDVYSDSGGR